MWQSFQFPAAVSRMGGYARMSAQDRCFTIDAGIGTVDGTAVCGIIDRLSIRRLYSPHTEPVSARRRTGALPRPSRQCNDAANSLIAAPGDVHTMIVQAGNCGHGYASAPTAPGCASSLAVASGVSAK
jgi:hypothetical protein